ncbi:DUF7266 family protein [Halorussus amylolyticus]|uniref:DUF7266 family protein n=1 Tax=Halorussus amylolyticus TaxID=1126242 RepID=UPI00104FC58E|nr:hypothetical protein [Halorussus amylolyticus]
MTRRPRSDERGVSVTVNYALNLVVATLLVSGLLLATGNVVEDRRESAAEAELEVVGNRLAANLEAAGRLASVGGSDAEVRVEADLPASVAGATYSVEIDDGGERLLLETNTPETTVRVPVRTSATVETTRVGGGDIVITLAADGDLEVERG